MYKKIEKFLYPSRCMICNELLEDEDCLICRDCFEKNIITNEKNCLKCGRKVNGEGDFCSLCKKNIHYFSYGKGMFRYTNEMKKSLEKLKYFNATWIGANMGELLADFYMHSDMEKPDIVIPIPLHPLKKIIRGYNQSQIIAEKFSKITKIPMDSTIIKRIKYTKPMKDLNGKSRVVNLHKAFKIKKSRKFAIKDKILLIVDDIYTTGSTIDMCSNILLRAGAKKVIFLTVAIVDEYKKKEV